MGRIVNICQVAHNRTDTTVGIGEATATAHASMAALQKRVALLDRQQASRAHDDSKLGIGEANHVPDDIPEKIFPREKSGPRTLTPRNTSRDNFARMESRNPELLSHSDYWRLQAQESRLAAQRLEDPEARADLLAKADEYDRFAACNSEWETRL